MQLLRISYSNPFLASPTAAHWCLIYLSPGQKANSARGSTLRLQVDIWGDSAVVLKVRANVKDFPTAKLFVLITWKSKRNFAETHLWTSELAHKGKKRSYSGIWGSEQEDEQNRAASERADTKKSHHLPSLPVYVHKNIHRIFMKKFTENVYYQQLFMEFNFLSPK